MTQLNDDISSIIKTLKTPMSEDTKQFYKVLLYNIVSKTRIFFESVFYIMLFVISVYLLINLPFSYIISMFTTLEPFIHLILFPVIIPIVCFHYIKEFEESLRKIAHPVRLSEEFKEYLRGLR